MCVCRIVSYCVAESQYMLLTAMVAVVQRQYNELENA